MVSRMPRLTIERLWAAAIPLLIFFLVSTSPITPNDFWWHLRAGQELITMRQIPTVDTYSAIMRGSPYPSYASFWLMEGAFYLIYLAGGVQLVLFVHSLVITTAYTLLMILCWRVSHSWRAAAASTVFAVAVGASAWAVRPQVIAYPLGVLTLCAIYAYRARPRAWILILFPVIMLVWVNSHGSFIVELVMLSVWLAAETIQVVAQRVEHRALASVHVLWPPFLALATTLLATMVNPRGPASMGYVFNLVANPVIENMVPEWAAANSHTVYGAIFFAGLLLCSVLLAVSPQRPSPLSLVTFVVFAGLALWTTRGMVWFGIVMAPIMARHLAAVASTIRVVLAQRKPLVEASAKSSGGDTVSPGVLIINYTLLGVLLLGSVLALPWFVEVLPLPASRTSVIAPQTPVEATRFLLAEHPPGPIFNDLVFGSYLAWAAQPDYPVFADPRLELYPLQHWLKYLSISAGQSGWEDKLDGYGINTLMLSRANQAGLIAQARQSLEWRLVYEDPYAVIFVRTKML